MYFNTNIHDDGRFLKFLWIMARGRFPTVCSCPMPFLLRTDDPKAALAR